MLRVTFICTDLVGNQTEAPNEFLGHIQDHSPQVQAIFGLLLPLDILHNLLIATWQTSRTIFALQVD
jgi:hypothetical protein